MTRKAPLQPDRLRRGALLAAMTAIAGGLFGVAPAHAQTFPNKPST